jgi:hypothetical protein
MVVIGRLSAARTPAARPQEPERDTEDRDRREYFEERKLLLDARQRGYQKAEQMIMGGSAGALVLSVTFLEKLAPAASVHHTWLLVGAWIVLLVCLGLSLFGQYASAWAFDSELARLDALVNNQRLPKNRWRVRNTFCSVVSAGTLVVGIALLATFAFVNRPYARGEDHGQDKSAAQDLYNSNPRERDAR